LAYARNFPEVNVTLLQYVTPAVAAHKKALLKGHQSRFMLAPQQRS
jgi:hypothetical protein